MNYATVLTCRNEEENISMCINSVLHQSIKPQIFIIVDDGSNDKTYDIITDYKSKYKIIHPIRLCNKRYRIPGWNISLAIRKSMNELTSMNIKYDYVLKMDADAYIPKHYVETITDNMEGNKKIGISGGASDIKKIDIDHVADAAKIYRKSCLLQLLPYPITHGHDSFTQLRALYKGWKIRCLKVRYKDMRPYKRNTFRWFMQGRFRYINGFCITHAFYRFIRELPKSPYFIGSIISFLSYITSMINDKRIFEEEYYRFIKSYLTFKFWKYGS